MKKLLLLSIVFTFSFAMNAQEFLRPFHQVSTKKNAYITFEDGTELETPVKRIRYKKLLIEGFSIEDENNNKKEVSIEDVKFAYLPQSGFDKLSKMSDFSNDATQWGKGLYDKERLKQGYAYFEKVTVMVKKEKMTLLLQLLNPTNTSRIKVFKDMKAGESGGFGVNGMQLSKSIDKSFYIQKDNTVAVRLQKSNFKKEFINLFGDCDAFMSKYKDPKWKEFEEMIFYYNEKCGK